MNTIGDMQNEINIFYHYNMFEYNHDFVIFLDNNVYLLFRMKNSTFDKIITIFNNALVFN